MTYDEIMAEWKKVKDPEKVFSGHFLVNFVTQSNQIEDINVDYNTTRELFESETMTNYTGDLRDAFSVLNNKRVSTFLKGELGRKARLDTELILETHRLLLFASVDAHRYEDNGERAGEFKKHDYCVGQLNVGSLPEEVPSDIADLCDLIRGIEGKDPLKAAAVFQCHFEYIHPFADGNGRVGRWLTNYLLVLLGHPPVLFERTARKEYYKALEAFDATDEYTPMYSYLRQQTINSWRAVRSSVGISSSSSGMNLFS